MEVSKSERFNDVTNSVARFTSDICKILYKSINVGHVCSPLSAHIALSMAAYGADENTAAEMWQVLRTCCSNSELLDDYQEFLDTLNTDENLESDSELLKSLEETINEILRDEATSDEQRDRNIQKEREIYEEIKLRNKKTQCVATLANKMYITNTIKVREDYENALNTYFRSKSETLDFSNKEESAEIINNWCSQTTNGKISEIVKSEQFSQDTTFVLVNVVYFKGTWLHEFQPATPKAFYLSTFNTIKVPTMYVKTTLAYRNLRELHAKAVRLNFTRSDKYMDIIVPNRIDGLTFVAKNLNKMREDFDKVAICLWLPKFEVKSDIKLEEQLIKMGMVDAFDEDRANFKKISDAKLSIKTVLQKAYVKVDELGCEATAVAKVQLDTKKSLKYSRKTPKFTTVKVNRAFLFRIVDSKLNIPLFIGTVVNPTK